jgi:hypothetical protein
MIVIIRCWISQSAVSQVELMSKIFLSYSHADVKNTYLA